MTYDEIRAALSAYMHRTDPETVANEPTALELARVKLNRSFFPEGASVINTALALVAGQAALPADFGQADVVSTATGDLSYCTPREFTRLAGQRNSAGVFSISGQQIHCDAAVSTVAMLYYRVADVVSGAATNWLSTGYPDVWIWAAVAEQHRFVQDWESGMAADSYYAGLAQSAMNDTRANRVGGVLRMVTRR